MKATKILCAVALAASLLAWPSAASADGDPECVWIHAYLNDGSQVAR